jgi:hypothetical protein
MQTSLKSGEIKAIGTEMLRALNSESIRLGLNRNLKASFFKRADPDGRHTINIFMVHEHASGRRVAPHYRCEVLAKLRRSNDPCYLILDIPFASWDVSVR